MASKRLAGSRLSFGKPCTLGLLSHSAARFGDSSKRSGAVPGHTRYRVANLVATHVATCSMGTPAFPIANDRFMRLNRSKWNRDQSQSENQHHLLIFST